MVSRVYPAMSEPRIAIVGLGYVGLPLAIEFGKIFNTVSFDTNKKRINQLKDGYDITTEVTSSDFLKSQTILSLQILLMISRVATCTSSQYRLR